MYRHTAIRNLYPSVVTIDDTTGCYDKNNIIVNVDDAVVDAEIARLTSEYENNQYQRDRALEYPAIEDQLDDIFHNGVEGWKLTIQAVKDKYPKE